MVGVVQDSDAGFRRYLAAIERFPRLDRKTELKLARRCRRRDPAAAEALVQSHLRSVVQIASRYRGYGIRFSDLVEEGNLGLLEALRRFEPRRGLRFMTYASYWVRAYILSHVLKHWSIVGIGTGPLQSRLFFRLQGARARIESSLGDRVDDLDGRLADTLSTSEEQVRHMAGRLGGRDASLDARLYADGDTTLGDRLVDESSDQEEHAGRTEREELVRALVAKVWDRLDWRERVILTERIMPQSEEQTLAALGRRLGVSRERVRQLEDRVKDKLRRALGPVQLEAAGA